MASDGWGNAGGAGGNDSWGNSGGARGGYGGQQSGGYGGQQRSSGCFNCGQGEWQSRLSSPSYWIPSYWRPLADRTNPPLLIPAEVRPISSLFLPISACAPSYDDAIIKTTMSSRYLYVCSQHSDSYNAQLASPHRAACIGRAERKDAKKCRRLSLSSRKKERRTRAVQCNTISVVQSSWGAARHGFQGGRFREAAGGRAQLDSIRSNVPSMSFPSSSTSSSTSLPDSGSFRFNLKQLPPHRGGTFD